MWQVYAGVRALLTVTLKEKQLGEALVLVEGSPREQTEGVGRFHLVPIGGAPVAKRSLNSSDAQWPFAIITVTALSDTLVEKQTQRWHLVVELFTPRRILRAMTPRG